MTIYYQDDQTTVHHGDCIEVMRYMPENSVDAIVTDPPYGLGFMGAKWDALPPGKDWAEECLRVLKPGGHLLAFGGTRTWHRLAVAIEDAGFEIRDSVMWLYGSGFPKSHDVSKAIDKAGGDALAFRRFARAYSAAVEASDLTHADIDRQLGIKSSSCYWAREDHRGGMPPRHHWETVRGLLGLDAELSRLYDEAEREVTQTGKGHHRPGEVIGFDQRSSKDRERRDTPATVEAAEWDGWGTALKPATEPIVMARKPFKGTVAANVLEHGTGALNIDASRIEGEPTPINRLDEWSGFGQKERPAYSQTMNTKGRWPANVILDEHMAEVLDQQSGVSKSPAPYVQQSKSVGIYGPEKHHDRPSTHHGDSGGASRFFHVIEQDAPFIYCAKAPKKERPVVDGISHPTTKPLKLMRLLVRMVTPPNGIVLDPFAGSGTTIEAALLEGFQGVGIELTDEYLPLIQQRIQRQRALL